MRRAYVRGAVGGVVLLAGLALIAILLAESLPNQALFFVFRRFLHDTEASLPTLFNFLLIMLNIFLLLIIYLSGRTQRDALNKYWLALCLLFFFLAFDEAAQLHEKTVPIMRELLITHPLLHFSWTPIGAAVSIAVFLLFLPFLKRLRRSVAMMMFLGGCVFVSGALGVETAAGVYDFHYDRDWQYHLIALVEESLEMTGMILFGYALLLHIETDVGPILVVTVGPATPPDWPSS